MLSSREETPAAARNDMNRKNDISNSVSGEISGSNSNQAGSQCASEDRSPIQNQATKESPPLIIEDQVVDSVSADNKNGDVILKNVTSSKGGIFAQVRSATISGVHSHGDIKIAAVSDNIDPAKLEAMRNLINHMKRK